MYLETIMSGRRFFKTHEGYIGLCPESARPGDQITVIIGIPSPLLLRLVPTAGGRMKYQLVGECFVHGMMWAEVFLGQLPSCWERRCTTIDGIAYPIFIHEGRSPLQDPRLGPLPKGWRIRYGQKGIQRTITMTNLMTKEICGIIGLNFQGQESGVGRIPGFRQKL